MRIREGLMVAAMAAVASAAHAADAPAPTAPMGGPEFLFDGAISTTYTQDSVTPWIGGASARGTIVTGSGWGASLTGLAQTSLDGASATVSGGQIDVFKNFAGGAIGVSYAVATGSGVTVSGASLQGAFVGTNTRLLAGIGHTFGGGVAETNTVSAQLEYYCDPNFDGYVGVNHIWASSSETNLFVGAEKKFASTPFSLFGNVAYATTASAASVTVGIRFTPSALSLQDFRRKVPF